MHWLIFYFAFVSKLYLWNMLNNECLPCSYTQSMDVDKVLKSRWISLHQHLKEAFTLMWQVPKSCELWLICWYLVSLFCFHLMCWSREGGDKGVRIYPPPWKILKLYVSLWILVQTSWKSQSYQAIIQCFAIIMKRYLNGIFLVGQWWPTFGCILGRLSLRILVLAPIKKQIRPWRLKKELDLPTPKHTHTPVQKTCICY